MYSKTFFTDGRWLALAVAIALFAGDAHACTGGALVKGSFGVLIKGPSVSGGSELYAGVLTSNGKCGLSGSLTGGIDGVTATTATIAGTYTVNVSGVGSMSFTLPGGTSLSSFTFGVVAKKMDLTGIETDNAAVATIDLSSIKSAAYSNASLSGTYVWTCEGLGRLGNGPESPGAEIDFITYDGAGNFSETAIDYNNASYSSTGTYTVNPDGSFSTINNAFSNESRIGSIVAAGTELHVGEFSLGNSGVLGPYLACVAKK